MPFFCEKMSVGCSLYICLIRGHPLTTTGGGSWRIPRGGQRFRTNFLGGGSEILYKFSRGGRRFRATYDDGLFKQKSLKRPKTTI